MKTRIARSQTRGERKKRPLKPLPRKVHIDGQVWTYRVGGSRICIRPPDNSKTYFAPECDVLNQSWDWIERASWKGYHPGVCPSHVKMYIEQHLVPDAPGWAPEVKKVRDYETGEEINLFSTHCFVLLEPGHPWEGAFCPHHSAGITGRQEASLHLYHANFWYKHDYPMTLLRDRVKENPSLETWAMFRCDNWYPYWKRVEVIFREESQKAA